MSSYAPQVITAPPTIENLSPDLQYQLWEKQRRRSKASWIWTAIAIAPAAAFVLIPQLNGLVTGAYRVADFFNLVSDTSAIDAAELGLEVEQAQNAQTIIEVGRSIDGITDRDIQIALMTASQESNLYNLTHGDDWWFQQNGWGETSDSRGLFQQRASWGTEECRMNPECSAKLFYEALLEVPNREDKELGEIAQSVQNSAFPGEYSKWEEQAIALLDAATKPNGVMEIVDKGEKPSTSSNVLDLPQPLTHNQMVPGGKVSSLYGDRILNGVPDFHAGLDIAAPEGTPILAPIDLCIKSAISDGDGSGFGNYLIATPKGRDDVELIFGHNSKNIATAGECYAQGEAIAEVGNTGNSFGAHLHIEITDLSGKSSPDGNMPWDVDPGPWFGVSAVEWGK